MKPMLSQHHSRPSHTRHSVEPDPIEVRTRWSIVALAVVAGIAVGFAVGKVPPAIVVISADFGLGKVAAGWLASIFFAFGAGFGVMTGMAGGRIGARNDRTDHTAPYRPHRPSSPTAPSNCASLTDDTVRSHAPTAAVRCGRCGRCGSVLVGRSVRTVGATPLCKILEAIASRASRPRNATRH